MAQPTVITDLKKLLKQDLFELPYDDYIAQIRNESDRSAIVLMAAYVESHLVSELRERMPSLNSEETTRIFDFNGPLGSFSDRIWLAQALGIIDRPMRRQIDLIREMRNVAAHAHPNVSFSTPEIRAAVLSLFDEDVRRIFNLFGDDAVRKAFLYYCAYIVVVFTGQPPANAETPREILISILRRNIDEIKASLEKSRKRSPPNRPAKGRKGKPPSPRRKPSRP